MYEAIFSIASKKFNLFIHTKRKITGNLQFYGQDFIDAAIN